MSEDRALDATFERANREEQDDLDRKHGQHILDVTDYAKERQEDPLLEALNRAHQAKAEEANQE
jgi:hypothetical protein